MLPSFCSAQGNHTVMAILAGILLLLKPQQGSQLLLEQQVEVVSWGCLGQILLVLSYESTWMKTLVINDLIGLLQCALLGASFGDDLDAETGPQQGG